MHKAATPFLAVRELAQRLNDSGSDYDVLLEMARGRVPRCLHGEAAGRARFTGGRSPDIA